MFVLENIKSIRNKTIEIVRNSSLETINAIPPAFNNNIIWNFGHIVVSGYSLVFRVTGADPDFQIPFLEKYKKGSSPNGSVSKEEIEELIDLSNTYELAVKTALDSGKFESITQYTTGTFGVTITTIDEMLITVAQHETCHWQTIRDYKRILDQTV